MNTYPITFTPEQLDVIAQALSEMPYKVAAPILETIQTQFNQVVQSRLPQDNPTTE